MAVVVVVVVVITMVVYTLVLLMVRECCLVLFCLWQHCADVLWCDKMEP
jgi:hypothetical protein